ncbi:MAG: GTPase Era [Rhodospirillaceae bacterium]
MIEDQTQCGFVALLGAPNVGKSTLMNTLVGSKVSIVTHKVQTTRTRVIGVLVKNRSQLIFVDTPGIFEPKRRLERAMVTAAWSGISEADILVLLVDASRPDEESSQRIIKELRARSREVILVVNKIDKIERTQLLGQIDRLRGESIFSEVFLLSALNGDGVGALISYLKKKVPKGAWLYPEDHLSDMNERLFAAEITREKLFLQLHQELPYSLTVETEEWEKRDGGTISVKQIIYVAREGQRGILLGKGGQQIKRIGMASRKELESILECRVDLFLFVKVREKWRDDPERYREMGLKFID